MKRFFFLYSLLYKKVYILSVMMVVHIGVLDLFLPQRVRFHERLELQKWMLMVKKNERGSTEVVQFV
jgi:hypothetical protein